MPLLRLPNELLLMIATKLEKDRDINAFVRTNRRTYAVLDRYLYYYNAWESKRPKMKWAVLHGRESVVRKLLQEGTVSSPWQMGGLLSLAVSVDQEDIIKIFLERGVDPNISVNVRDQTPLALAADYGHVGIVKLMLENGGDPDQLDHYGFTSLGRALASGRGDAAMVLMEKSRNLSWHHFGRGLMSYAAEFGFEEVVEFLLKQGLEPDPRTLDTGLTPLAVAARNGHVNVVRLLLQTGRVDINSKDLLDTTILSVAADNGYGDVVELLLDNDAIPVAKDSLGYTALHYAVQRGNEEIAILLMKHGANPESTDCQGRTALAIAAFFGHNGLVRHLLKEGANLEAKTLDEKTPLILAAWSGQVDTVSILLANGADIYCQDNLGLTATSYAINYGSHEILELLIKRRYELEYGTVMNMTNLIMAPWPDY